MSRLSLIGAFTIAALLASTASQAEFATFRTKPERSFRQVGIASWYGPGFHGRTTASGDTFNQNKLTAAHRRLPLGAEVTVTNLENGRSVTVEINDRGPYIDGRIIDLSKAAARRIGIVEDGIAKVEVQARPEQLAAAAGS